MKRYIFTLIAAFASFVSTFAMSYEEARQEALYLTDKMAYELNLNDEQYEYAYEINLDYLMGLNSADDVYGTYWTYRNSDLRAILYDWQWALYTAADYFYRPITWRSGRWYYPIYDHYRHDYYYFNRPSFYYSYRGHHGRVNYTNGWYANRRPTWNGGFRGHDRTYFGGVRESMRPSITGSRERAGFGYERGRRGNFGNNGMRGEDQRTGNRDYRGNDDMYGRYGSRNTDDRMNHTGREGYTGRENQTGRESQTGREGYTGREGQTGREGFTGREGQTGREGYTGRENRWEGNRNGGPTMMNRPAQGRTDSPNINGERREPFESSRGNTQDFESRQRTTTYGGQMQRGTDVSSPRTRGTEGQEYRGTNSQRPTSRGNYEPSTSRGNYESSNTRGHSSMQPTTRNNNLGTPSQRGTSSTYTAPQRGASNFSRSTTRASSFGGSSTRGGHVSGTPASAGGRGHAGGGRFGR